MNKILKEYYISVQFTDVSGAEYLDLLSMRDELAQIRPKLTKKEQEILTKADQLLIKNCQPIYQELSRFVDLSSFRQQHQITSQQWWWYLDVLCYLPNFDLPLEPKPLIEIA
jgi:hypothetical protein